VAGLLLAAGVPITGSPGAFASQHPPAPISRSSSWSAQPPVAFGQRQKIEKLKIKMKTNEDVLALTPAASPPNMPVHHIRLAQLPAASRYMSLPRYLAVLALRATSLYRSAARQDEQRLDFRIVDDSFVHHAASCLAHFLPILLHLAFCFYVAFTYLLTILTLVGGTSPTREFVCTSA